MDSQMTPISNDSFTQMSLTNGTESILSSIYFGRAPAFFMGTTLLVGLYLMIRYSSFLRHRFPSRVASANLAQREDASDDILIIIGSTLLILVAAGLIYWHFFGAESDTQSPESPSNRTEEAKVLKRKTRFKHPKTRKNKPGKDSTLVGSLIGQPKGKISSSTISASFGNDDADYPRK